MGRSGAGAGLGGGGAAAAALLLLLLPDAAALPLGPGEGGGGWDMVVGNAARGRAGASLVLAVGPVKRRRGQNLARAAHVMQRRGGSPR